MIAQAIMRNDKGRSQNINTNFLKHLAFVEKWNKDEVEREVVKTFKNGAWIEETTADISITVDKNRNKKGQQKKLYLEQYKVIRRTKFIEDKKIQFKNGKFFVEAIESYKPVYKLIGRVAI